MNRVNKPCLYIVVSVAVCVLVVMAILWKQDGESSSIDHGRPYSLAWLAGRVNASTLQEMLARDLVEYQASDIEDLKLRFKRDGENGIALAVLLGRGGRGAELAGLVSASGDTVGCIGKLEMLSICGTEECRLAFDDLAQGKSVSDVDIVLALRYGRSQWAKQYLESTRNGRYWNGVVSAKHRRLLTVLSTIMLFQWESVHAMDWLEDRSSDPMVRTSLALAVKCGLVTKNEIIDDWIVGVLRESGEYGALVEFAKNSHSVKAVLAVLRSGHAGPVKEAVALFRPQYDYPHMLSTDSAGSDTFVKRIDLLNEIRANEQARGVLRAKESAGVLESIARHGAESITWDYEILCFVARNNQKPRGASGETR